MLKRSTVSGPMMRSAHQGVERHHRAGFGAHIEEAQVVRRAAEIGLRRQADAEGAAEQREVVDVEAAERALHGLEDRRHRNAERLRLVAVDVGPVLRHGGAEQRLHAAQLRPLCAACDHLVRRCGKRVQRAARAVLQVELEAAGRADARNGRRVDAEHDAVAEVRVQRAEGACGDRASGPDRCARDQSFSVTKDDAGLVFCASTADRSRPSRTTFSTAGFLRDAFDAPLARPRCCGRARPRAAAWSPAKM